MEEFTYEEIRAKALKQGVKDNIFQHVGAIQRLHEM